jgi:hypothetical protein
MSVVLTLWPTCQHPTFPAKLQILDPYGFLRQYVFLVLVWNDHMHMYQLAHEKHHGCLMRQLPPPPPPPSPPPPFPLNLVSFWNLHQDPIWHDLD